MSGWKQREGLLVLLIGMILIVGILVAVIAFVPLSFFEHHDAEEVELGNADTLKLTVNADVTDVKIGFQDLGNLAMKVDLDIEGRTGFVSGEPDVALTVHHEHVGNKVNIEVVLGMDTGPTVSYDVSNLVIFIDFGLRTEMDVNVNVGEVFLWTTNPVDLNGVSIFAKVGGVNADLGNGTSILDDLDLKSGVGSVGLIFSSPLLNDNVNINLSTKTGSVFLGLNQGEGPGINATCHCHTDIGSIGLELVVLGETGAEITSQANVGDISTDLNGFGGTDAYLESDNFPGEHNLSFFLQSDVGSIDIDAEWSG